MSFTFIGTGQLPPAFTAQGHRGARGLLPENTLPAFEAALDLGVTTLEFDLHFTQDGELIIWHDPVIDKSKCRLPDTVDDVPDPRHPLRHIMISQQPLAVLQTYQCDLNPEPDRFPEQTPVSMPLAGDNYHLITLAELFDFVDLYTASDLKTAEQRANAAQVQFNMETKRKPDNPEFINDGFKGSGIAGPFELAILEIVQARGLIDRVIVQSFDHRSLRAIRAQDDSIRLSALTRGIEPQIERYVRENFTIWSPYHGDLTPERLATAHEAGLTVIPWTVNEVTPMRQFIEWGVDGIISDRPDLLLALPEG